MIPRRETILGATAASLAFAAHAAASPPMARGRVLEQTGNGTRAIPGILVSNGQDVVRTGTDGAWQLPIAEGDSVFVIKPTGWASPVDPITQLPHFAYVHSPTGSPASLGLRFAGMAPTGPLPDSIDFVLRRQDEPTRFDALLLTDPQPESIAELGHVRDDVAAQLRDFPAAFGIGLGDLMFDDLAFYDRYNRIIGTAGIPWHNCPGNHDMNYEAPDNALSRETFKRIFGARYHAFQYGGATFLLLDNVEYLGTDASRPMAAGHYRGRFGPRQLAFVRNVLAQVPRDALVVVCHHIPLHTQLADEPANANTDTADFLAAIGTHPNCVSFSGHTHTNEHWYLGPDGKPASTGHHHHVLSAASGSWWSGPDDVRGIPAALATDGSPSGFHLLSVDGNQARTRLIPSHDPARSLLRIVLDSQAHEGAPELLRDAPPGALLAGPVAAAQLGSTRVVVNFFEGGPNSRVELAVGEGGYTAMHQITRFDPFVQEVYGRNEPTIKPWVKPTKSTHIWQAGLPQTLPAGTHLIRVRARDEYGGMHATQFVLEVT
jgi:hypothetical protein